MIAQPSENETYLKSHNSLVSENEYYTDLQGLLTFKFHSAPWNDGLFQVKEANQEVLLQIILACRRELPWIEKVGKYLGMGQNPLAMYLLL